MSFPPAFLDELRARLPLSDLIGRRLKIVRAGREFKACCPFHHEKTPSFYINDDKGFFHCFGCGAHGDIIGFTMRHDNLSFPEAIEALAAQAGLEVPKETPAMREKYDQEKQLYHLLERATVWFESQLRSPSGRGALEYLAHRGLSGETLTRHRLGYAPNDAKALIKAMQAEGFSLEEMEKVGLAKKAADRPDYFSFFRHRVIFPVGDARGRTVAFGGRVMDGGEPKYLNSPDHPLFHKGRLLYGLSRARGAVGTGQPLIVVEGYMDVIALCEAGFTGAVAPLGTAMTADHLALLWRLLPPVATRDPTRDYSPILCFDGDGAGLRAAARAVERALPLITAAHTVRIATLPPPEDPDSLIKAKGISAMQAVLDEARPLIDMIWDQCLQGRRLQTPEDQAALIAALNEKIAPIGDTALRALYKDALQKRLAQTFGWQGDSPQQPLGPPPPRRGGFKAPFKGKGGTGWQRGVFPPEKAPQKPRGAKELMEKVLMALIVNNPALFPEVGEDLVSITFTNPSLEALRQQVITIMMADSHESLDAAELYRHLSQGDGAKACQKGLAEALCAETYMHARFARPGATLDEARKGWQFFWKTHLRETVEAELEEAKRRWEADPSTENWARVLSLREEITALSENAAQSAGGGQDIVVS